MNNEMLLHEEIRYELEKLRGMEVGTDEHKTAVDGVTKLMDRAIEIDKINVEHAHNAEARADERKDRIARHTLTALGIAVPTATAVWGTLKSLRFETTGTVTTIFGRGWLNKLLPRK